MSMAMAMEVAWIGRRKIVTKVASTIMPRWETRTAVEGLVNNMRRFTAAEKSKYLVPHRRLYGTSQFSAGDMNKFGRIIHDYNYNEYDYDLAVNKVIREYNQQIKEDGQSGTLYPLMGTSERFGVLVTHHILLGTTLGGEKYAAISVAPDLDRLPDGKSDLDEGSIKPVFFRKVDSTITEPPFDKVVGSIIWPTSPDYDPYITAVARFAFAQGNKKQELRVVIDASCQMISECDIVRMRIKSEWSRLYDAVVVVPQNKPENMELVLFRPGSNHDPTMFETHGPLLQYKYEESEDRVDLCSTTDPFDDIYDGDISDQCSTDEPRVIAAARFALAQHNKEDKLNRVLVAMRRRSCEREVFNMRLDSELDGSIYYKAIVSVPLNDPENMRLDFFGRSDDDHESDSDDYRDYDKQKHKRTYQYEEEDVDADGFDECSTDDPRVTEAARFALDLLTKKDKVRRVIKASSEKDGTYEILRMRFAGERHPLRPYGAIVLVPLDYPESPMESGLLVWSI